VTNLYISPAALESAANTGIERMYPRPDHIAKVGEYLGNLRLQERLQGMSVILRDGDEPFNLDSHLWKVGDTDTAAQTPDLYDLPPDLHTVRSLARDDRTFETLHIAVQDWHESQLSRALYRGLADNDGRLHKHYMEWPLGKLSGTGIGLGLSIILNRINDPAHGAYLIDEHAQWTGLGFAVGMAADELGRGGRALNRYYRLGKLAPITLVQAGQDSSER